MVKPRLCLEHALSVASMFRKLPHLDRHTRREIARDIERQHCVGPRK